MTDGIVIDEDEEQILNFPLFDKNRITGMEINDCKTIQILSNVHEDIAIYGPVRIVHFGKRLHEQFKELKEEQLKELKEEQLKELKEEQLKDKMFDIILNVNYKLPNFEYGNVMQIGYTDEDKKTLKLLTNKTDYIIDKYDYILIDRDGEEQPPIMITNAILNTMLPSNWTLVDEFTVVAPMTDKNEWNKLLIEAEKHDLTDEFFNNRNTK